MTKELENHVKKKTKAWNTYLGAKSFSNWTFYKIHTSVTNSAKIAKINCEYKLVHDMIIRRPVGSVTLTQKTMENVADLRTCKKGIYAKISVNKANILNSFLLAFH